MQRRISNTLDQTIFMRLIFLFSLMLNYNQNTNAQLSLDALRQAHVSKLEHAQKYTTSVLHLFDDSLLLFKPTEDEMTVSQQITHLCQNIVWLSGLLSEKKEVPFRISKEKKYTKIELLELISTAYTFGIEAMRSLSEASLFNTTEVANNKLNKIQLLNLIQDHQTHHRAQLLVYLRLNGIKPPSYTGW